MESLKIHDSLLGATLHDGRGSERKILAVWLSGEYLTCLVVASGGYVSTITLPDYNWSMKVEK